MTGTNANMKDIYLYGWCGPTFIWFQSNFCSTFKFLFNKLIIGRMSLQDGQRWDTNRFQHEKKKQQNRWGRQQCTVSARNELLLGKLCKCNSGVYGINRDWSKTLECMFRIYQTMCNFEVWLRNSYAKLIHI